MAASHHNVEPITTNDDEIPQLMINIQTTNLHLVPSLDHYLNELQMLIQTLNNSVLSFSLSATFAIPMEWLSLATSIVVFNKTIKVVIFLFLNSKTKKLPRKQFTEILRLLVLGTFY